MIGQTSSKKVSVLLADDHSIVRAGIRKILEHAGDIEVIAEADNGAEAKTLIQRVHPDVAVLDVQMPEASGIEVTRWVRNHVNDVGVLILTAYNDDPYVMAVLQAGANGYVLKTSSPEDLIRAVHEVHEGKSVLDPAVANVLMAHVSGKPNPLSTDRLSDREIDVLSLAAKGFTNKAIGIQLGISDRTVQGHLAHIFDKLGVASRTEAVMQALSLGLIMSEKTGKPHDEPIGK
jgi:DNA-binding NarL/FixJ family response regulator